MYCILFPVSHLHVQSYKFACLTAGLRHATLRPLSDSHQLAAQQTQRHATIFANSDFNVTNSNSRLSNTDKERLTTLV